MLLLLVFGSHRLTCDIGLFNIFASWQDGKTGFFLGGDGYCNETKVRSTGHDGRTSLLLFDGRGTHRQDEHFLVFPFSTCFDLGHALACDVSNHMASTMEASFQYAPILHRGFREDGQGAGFPTPVQGHCVFLNVLLRLSSTSSLSSVRSWFNLGLIPREVGKSLNKLVYRKWSRSPFCVDDSRVPWCRCSNVSWEGADPCLPSKLEPALFATLFTLENILRRTLTFIYHDPGPPVSCPTYF